MYVKQIIVMTYKIPHKLIQGLASNFGIVANVDEMTGEVCWNEIKRIHKELKPHFKADNPTYKALTNLVEKYPNGN